MGFGDLFRQLRYNKGISIKKLASALEVDYTYLSKIENGRVIPSEQMIERVSKYFDYSNDSLMLTADKIPEDIKRILRENPEESLEYLRRRFVNDDQPRKRAVFKNNRGPAINT